jgi:hypothetical protein
MAAPVLLRGVGPADRSSTPPATLEAVTLSIAVKLPAMVKSGTAYSNLDSSVDAHADGIQLSTLRATPSTAPASSPTHHRRGSLAGPPC